LFGWLKNINNIISNLNKNIDLYKKETIIQSLPSKSYVNRAKKFIEKNDYISAEAILKEALELSPKDALVYKYLGVVYERTAKPELALENYQLSADLDPHDKNVWQRLGFMLISVGKYENAEKSFDNANKIQAGNSDTYTGWGMALMKMQKFSEAHDKFLHASKLNKYNYSALFLSAVMEIKLGIYDKADSKLAFLTKVSPNESNTFEYARLKALRDDIDSAISYALKSIKYNSKMLPAYILLGQLYGKKLDKTEALNYFEKAETLGFNNPNLYLEWGKILVKFENFTDAKEKLLKANELLPNDNDIMANLGLCYASCKDFIEAEQFLNRVIEKDNDNAVVKQTLGIIAYEKGEYDKALAILKHNDEDAINCYYIAKCYEKKSNNTKTIEYYEASIRLNDKNINTYIDYTNYLITKNEYAEAQRKLRKALKIDEDNITLLNLMFYVSYILVKDNICDYNLKEVLLLASKIEHKGIFNYPEQKQELENILQEREKH